MAKSTNHANHPATGAAMHNFAEVPSSAEDAEFLENLNQKQAAALCLSEQLAVWFGNYSRPSSFTPAVHP
jgi:hypothetical protein